jgi:hypothetical protein
MKTNEELIDSVRQSPRNSSIDDIIRLADLAHLQSLEIKELNNKVYDLLSELHQVEQYFCRDDA